MRAVLVLQFAGVFLVALTGCGDSARMTKSDVSPVKGKVLLPGGQPMRLGRVIFNPVDRAQCQEAIGELEADGSFRLTTFEKDDGAVPGEYIVTIDAMSYKKAVPKEIHSRQIPPSFRNVKTSQLRVEVKSETNELKAFQLR